MSPFGTLPFAMSPLDKSHFARSWSPKIKLETMTKPDSFQLSVLGKSEMYISILRFGLECIPGYRSNGSFISSLSITSGAPAASTSSTILGYGCQASPILLLYMWWRTYRTCIEVKHAIGGKRCLHALSVTLAFVHARAVSCVNLNWAYNIILYYICIYSWIILLEGDSSCHVT